MRGIRQSWSEDSYDPEGSAGLFVGIREFERGGFRQIPYAVDDAVDLAYLFSCDLALIPPGQVQLALSGAVQKEVSRARLRSLRQAGAREVQTTRNGLVAAVGKLARRTGEGGLLVAAFATHGFSQDGVHRLVASNSVREDLKDTGVDVPTIVSRLLTSPCQRRVLILDACQEVLEDRSHRGSAESADAAFLEALTQSRGLVHLAGAGYGGRAYDDLHLHNGVFTEAILRGLRGEAPAAEHGFITLGTLVSFVRQRVQRWFSEHSPSTEQLHSGLDSRLSGDLDRLPLASADQGEIDRRRWRERKALALLKLRDNVGSVIEGRHLDEIKEHLGALDPSASLLELLDRIEDLDGQQQSQESFLFFYQHRWQGPEASEPDHFQRGLEHMYGLSGKVDYASAQTEFQASARAGDAVAQVWWAWLASQGNCGMDRDLEAANRLGRRDLDETRLRAEGGDPLAEMVWGIVLIDGVGVEKDPDEALECLRHSASVGNSIAMVCVGYLLTGERSSEQDSSAAFQWFQTAAKMGNASGLRNLGFSYEHGSGVEPDPAQALILYRKAAEMGDPTSMVTLGIKYEHGQGVTQDVEESRAWYRRAAEAGNASGMSNYGVALLQASRNEISERSRERITEQGLGWLRRSVAAGDTYGMRYLGAIYADGAPLPQDFQKTLGLWRQAAELGDTYAMDSLAGLLARGEGVTQDLDEAFSWYQSAAEAGLASAMVRLGEMLQAGSTGTPRPEEAVFWYAKAADLGFSEGYFSLGNCFNEGIGTVEDPGSAAECFRLAAETGHVPAVNSLGVLYQTGRGVPEDLSRAVRLYQQAAEAGDGYGMFNLGVLHLYGVGLPKNPVAAREWLEKAHQAGNTSARQFLESQASELKAPSLWDKLVSWVR